MKLKKKFFSWAVKNNLDCGFALTETFYIDETINCISYDEIKIQPKETRYKLYFHDGCLANLPYYINNNMLDIVDPKV